MRFTKILSGFIAINALLVIVSALLFFALQPLAETTGTLLLAGGTLGILLVSGSAGALIIKNLTPPLKNLIQHLDGEAHSLEDSAGRLNGAAQALAENAARNSASLEDAAHSLSRVAALILRGVDNLDEARTALTEISQIVGHASETLGKIDTNVRLDVSAAHDISAEAIQLSSKADELIEAINGISAFIHGNDSPAQRESLFKNKLARQMLVKALPVADI